MLELFPGPLVEARSTQCQEGLAALVVDGFGFLKVWPSLTFALREALYGLYAIRRAVTSGAPQLFDTIEQLMLTKPGSWWGHSDRIHYCWDDPAGQAAVAALLAAKDSIEETLISQYCAGLCKAIRTSQRPIGATRTGAGRHCSSPFHLPNSRQRRLPSGRQHQTVEGWTEIIY